MCGPLGLTCGVHLRGYMNHQTDQNWDAEKKIAALRTLFRRAVVLPLINVESLWRRFEAFENGLNRTAVSLTDLLTRTCLRVARRSAVRCSDMANRHLIFFFLVAGKDIIARALAIIYAGLLRASGNAAPTPFFL